MNDIQTTIATLDINQRVIEMLEKKITEQAKEIEALKKELAKKECPNG